MYASPEYLAKRGQPRSVDEFQQHDCTLTEQQRQDGIWIFRNRSQHRFTEVIGKVAVVSRSLMLMLRPTQQQTSPRRPAKPSLRAPDL